MSLTRTPHWATREFHQFLLQRATEPFTWGKNDCSLFAADAIQSFTGVDLAEDFRGKYSDEASALTLCESITGTPTLEAAAVYCAMKFHLREWPYPRCAQRGDLVLVEESSRLISAVIHLNGRHAVTVGQDGLKLLPITSVRRAWAI
jgi:Domain of unknown function (DUF6950)